MNRVLSTIALTICVAALMVGLQTANATLVQQDSTAVGWYQYEMGPTNPDPTTQDLDGNLVNDGENVDNGAGLPSYSGGIMPLPTTTSASGYYLRSLGTD